MQPIATLLAGPNGAGKTTLLADLALPADTQFVLADQLAEPHRELGHSEVAANMKAGREAIAAIRKHTASRHSFIHETNLASGWHAQHAIPQLRQAGFQIRIWFVGVRSPELCVARVRQRVLEGGHDVPEVDIRRRWRSGLEHFFGQYQTLVDEWILVDTTGLRPELVAEGIGTAVVVHQHEIWSAYQELREHG